MRAPLHYLIAAIVIPVYGTEVCPFLESLSAAQISVPIVAALAFQFIFRWPFHKVALAFAPASRRSYVVFSAEMFLFFITSLGLLMYFMAVHDFPWHSGAKVMVGILGLGSFCAADLALEHDRLHPQAQQEGNHRLDYIPLKTRMIGFASAYLVILITVFTLLAIKDLMWIMDVGDSISIAEASYTIAMEFTFVLAVFLPHTINLIHAYTNNLSLSLQRQNEVMAAVTRGDYQQRVPALGHDEFTELALHTNSMVQRIQSNTDELARTRDVTIHSLASLAETRDNETGAHVLRTQRYVKALAIELKKHPDYAPLLDDETIELLYKSAPLHDVGKVGIADAILLKPGKHTEEEFEIMKTHAQLGADALAVAEQELGSNSFMRYAKEIALTHHEKWDGSGYPAGTSGHDIPLSGRLMAVADVYDALISKRVYKPAFPHEKAMSIIREGSGKHFDPAIVDALNVIEQEFVDIARQFRDEHTDAVDDVA